MISHEHRCIFVHVPKTGGSSLELLLTGYDWIAENRADYEVFLGERDTWRERGSSLDARAPGYFDRRLRVKHATQAMARAIYGQHWAEYLTFTFVRDPWARVVSIYRHGCRDAPGLMPATFAEWLRQPVVKDHVGQRVFQRFIDDWDGFDFVGRFEHFAEDAAVLLGLVGAQPVPALPHVDHGSTAVDHRPFYGEHEDLIGIVARHSQAEIEQFGYSFAPILRA